MADPPDTPLPDLPDVVTVLEYPYTRTTGPVLGAFLTGLRDGRVLGGRHGDRVLCPPQEYDPDTAEPADPELVEVGPVGTVTGWTWVTEPTANHPFDHPFAFALVLLDGADAPLVHAVDAGTPDAMATGMRVVARFHRERRGAVTDLHFVPGDDAEPAPPAPGAEGDTGPVRMTGHLISLRISEPLHPHRERFARGLLAGRIVGQRSPATGRVFVPGRGYDQVSGVEMTGADDVVVADRGTVVSYTVITPIAYYGQQETEPYIRASILLDGADGPLSGVDVRDIPVGDFRAGLRLRAVWKPEGERDVSGLDNRTSGALDGVVARWEPTGEPDVDPATIEEHAL
jgi:uncharacterized OB-fold protein